ncbi:MAG: IPT/TIG domain-containing protein [Planctomycetes bacterium]|nr:IPT/TIG domain-containing protein [Planctomycetota bacterium]
MARLLLTLVVWALFGAQLGAQVIRPLNQTTAPVGNIFGIPNTNAGWEFKVNSLGVRVKQLGCCTYDGNPRVITLFDSVERKVVAQATTPAVGAFQWRWATLTKPVMLKKDRKYVVVQFTGTYNYFLNNDINSYSYMKPTGNIEHVRTLRGAGDANTFPMQDMGGYVIEGITDIGYELVPALEVSAEAGTQQVVYPTEQGPGDNGIVAGKFTIRSIGLPQPAKIASVTIEASGSGDDSVNYNYLAVVRDVNSNGVYEPGADTLIGTAATAFPDDDGELVFAFQEAEQTFPALAVRKYLLLAKLSGSAPLDAELKLKVSAMDTDPGTGSDGAPTIEMEGLKVTHQPFDVTDYSVLVPEAAARQVEYVVQEFTVYLRQGPSRQVMDMTFEAYGSVDDVNDVVSFKLYRDGDHDGVYNPALDVLLGSDAFLQDNGFIRFDFPRSEPYFVNGDTWRYFVVVSLDYDVPHGATFKTRLIGAMERTVGIDFKGAPSPQGGPTPGLICRNHNLIASLNGPLSAESIPNNSLGPNRKGHVIADVTVTAFGSDWNVGQLEFRAGGSGDDSDAFSYLFLMEDINLTGAYEGLPQDVVATTGTPVSAFPADDGLYVAPLANTLFIAGSSRRFFLVAQFFGTAASGDSFNAALEGVNGVPPADGEFRPSETSAGPVVDLATITVAIASGSPGDTSVETGVEFSHVVAKFRFTAGDAPASVNGIQLTHRGKGDPTTDLRGIDGVQVWLDDGSGSFDATLDTQLFVGGGANPVTPCPFLTPVDLENGQTRDLWVRIVVLASAGGSIADTFQFAIEQVADVNAGNAVIVLAGSIAAVSSTLRVVQFSVTGLTPQLASVDGGASITVTGTGFALPVKLYIDGVECPGHAVVTVDGREITGLYVPPGIGAKLEVKLRTGGLAEKTLPMEFSYNAGSEIKDFDHTATCAAASGSAPWLIAPLALLGLVVVRRRKHSPAR